MITVRPRSRSREDRAGDPLDGLVNLFDLGLVLSVAFLLAALSSLHLGGRGIQTGVVYRLSNGQLVYVQQAPQRGH